MSARKWLLGPLVAAAMLAGCAEEDWGPDQHGKTISAAELDGRWLVVNYWAEWCAPCRTEIPELNALDKARSDVIVLGVNYDGLKDSALQQASADLGIEFRVLADDPAERLGLPKSAVLPVTYLVDAKGRVREQLIGEQTAEGLTARLTALKRR